MSRSKSPLLYIILISVFFSINSIAQTNGDFRSKASGNWSDYTTWQVYDGGVWIDAVSGQVPGGTSEADANNVYLEAGFTVTLTADASCKDLHLNTTADVVRINTQENTLNVWGKVRSYAGSAPGTNDNANAGIPGWIATGTVGKIKFKGTADRIIIYTGEYSAHANNKGYTFEFAFDAGKTAIIDESTRTGNAIISSGTLKVNPLHSLRPAGQGAPTDGDLIVKSGATLIGGQFFKSSSGVFLNFTLEENAYLYFDNTTIPILAAQNVNFLGTVGLRGTTSVFPHSGGRTAALINTFNDLIIEGTGTKTLQNNITVNKTLSLSGTAAIGLSTFTLSYGSSGTLEYNGTSNQLTKNAEFPIIDGPSNLVINNTSGVILHADRTIPGTLTLNQGLLYLGNFHLTLGEAAPQIAGTPSETSMIITNGTGELRKIFSTVGTYFFPIGDTTGIDEYTFAQITVNSATTLDNTTYFGVRVTDNEHAADAGFAIDNLSRYWKISSNTTSPNFSGTFQYVTADIIGTESSINSTIYTDETALSTKSIFNAINSFYHRITVNNLTNLGFITGSNHCAISNNILSTPPLTEFCNSTTLSAFDGAAATVSSGNPTYQWQSSLNSGAWEDISGATNEDYAVGSTLTEGTYKYRRLVSDLINCTPTNSNFSNEITITVISSISGNTIGSDQTIPNGGDPAAVTATTALMGGNGTYNYQWKYSHTQGGPYADYPSETSAILNLPAGVNQTTYIVREVTSGACTSTSNEVTITALTCSITNNSFSSSKSIEICSDKSLSMFDASAASVSSGSPVYQWQVNINDGGWTDISTNGTSEDFTESSSLAAGTYQYRRIVSDPTNCSSGMESVSDTITVTISSVITGNTIGTDQTVDAGGDPVALTETGSLAGGNGTYTYVWKSASVSGGPYSEIISETNSTYDPVGGIGATTYFIREVHSGACVSSSNEVTITVQPLSNVSSSLIKAIELYPNPFTNELAINLELAEKPTTSIVITNSIGTPVAESHMKNNVASQNYMFDLGHLPKGLYYAEIQLDNLSIVRYKIIKE